MSSQNPKAEQQVIHVVEDETALRKLVSDVLSTHGLNVLVAESAEDGLNVSRTHDGPIHLFLSDIQLPGMTGIELGTKVNSERPEIRVILMSGMDTGMLVLNEGWHFLPKPFIPSQLLNSVLTSLASPVF